MTIPYWWSHWYNYACWAQSHVSQHHYIWILRYSDRCSCITGVNMYYVIPSQQYACNSCRSSAPYIILRCLRSMKDMKLRYARSRWVWYSYGRHNTIRMMCARGSYNRYTTLSWSVLHALYSQSDVVFYWIRNRIMCVFQHVVCMCRNYKYDEL